MVIQNSKKESEKQILKNYVNECINKGFNKKQIKDLLLKKGIDEKLAKEVIYPNRKIFLASGIIFVLMILFIGGFFVFDILKNMNIDIFSATNETTNETTGEPSGIIVEDVNVYDDNGVNVVEVFLKNKGEKLIDEPIGIKVSSGNLYLFWEESRQLLSGETLKSVARGLVIQEDEPEIKVEINGEIVFTKSI